MATATYVLISEQTLGSAASSVTFSSIPGTYTDLVLEIVANTTTGAEDVLAFELNADTATNYSATRLRGTGAAAASDRASSNALSYTCYIDPALGAIQVQFFSYANTSMYKTFIGRSGTASGVVQAAVSLWRSTAAITSIKAKTGTNTMAAGSTFRLWGIA